MGGTLGDPDNRCDRDGSKGYGNPVPSPSPTKEGVSDK